MENKETSLYVKKVDVVKSKTGREFWSVENEQGDKYSCFEKTLAEKLIENIGRTLKIKVAINDQGFKNIRGIIDEVKTEKIEPKPVAKKTEPSQSEDNLEGRKLKDVSIYTSYAKDIFISLYDDEADLNVDPKEIMKRAVELVKQARDSFRESQNFPA